MPSETRRFILWMNTQMHKLVGDLRVEKNGFEHHVHGQISRSFLFPHCTTYGRRKKKHATVTGTLMFYSLSIQTTIGLRMDCTCIASEGAGVKRDILCMRLEKPQNGYLLLEIITSFAAINSGPGKVWGGRSDLLNCIKYHTIYWFTLYNA